MGNCTEMMLPFLPSSLWSSWWTLYARICKTQAYAVLRLVLAQVDLRVRQVLGPVAALHQDGSRTGLIDVLECWQMAVAQAREMRKYFLTIENGDKPPGSLALIGGVLVQAVDEISRSQYGGLRRYLATDITPLWGPALQQLVPGAPLDFMVRRFQMYTIRTLML